MVSEQYIALINGVKNLNSHQNEDLENSVSKIVSIETHTRFRIEDLIQNQKLNAVLLSKIEQILNLIFIKEESETNVCFANSTELRSGYRQNFTTIDLLDYLYAFAHSSFYRKSLNIVIVVEDELFWKLVKIGVSFRKGNK